jgi:hypothetical protein
MAVFKYRGRMITAEDILYIRELISTHPTESRRTLSKKLCEAWQWRQSNGALRDMVCRGLLLMLERAGQITLPPVSYVRHNPLANRARPAPVLIDRAPLEGQLEQIQPIEFQQVRRTAEEDVFNSLLEQRHYLGYEQPVGEHLKYLMWARGTLGVRPMACAAWSSAPRHLGSRDRYIGWSAEARRRNIRFIVMIALLKYGTGVPFHRLERLEGQLGMPLPATTQWDLMAAAAKLLQPVLEELIRQAAQGSVMHNDDTSMRVLRLTREPGDRRTGIFTSGVVSIVGRWRIALYFTGWNTPVRIWPTC